MRRTLQTAGWLFRSFGPLVSFYVILKVWGLVPAIVSGLAIGALLVAYEIWRELGRPEHYGDLHFHEMTMRFCAERVTLRACAT